MGLATHLGPWLLGTVKNTTGTTAGSVRNVGATSVGQSVTINYGDAATSTAFWIPAGSLITSVAFYSATGITGTTPTLTVYVGSTAITGTQSLTSATAFAATLPFAAAASGTIVNIGTVDQPIKYTIGGTGLSAGSGTLLVEYLVRNADGTYVAAYNNGP
jgi:hypothetical protein